MPRAMKEGDVPRLMAPEAERSDLSEERGSSLPDVPVKRLGTQTLLWGMRLKAAKTMASTPRFLGLAGIIILAISAGIIVAGIALPNQTLTSSPASSNNAPTGVDRDGEGVPLDALQAPGPGSLSECTVKLESWESYAKNAAEAEIKAYGVEIANATPDAIVSSLQSLPKLQLNIRFLVLYSPSHPWSRSFQSVAAVQTSLLDAAFSGMKLGFQLEGVIGIPATDKEVQNCGNSEEQSDSSSSSQDGGDDEGKFRSGGFISQVLQSVNTSNLINVIVCDPAGINGATNILGDGKFDSPAGNGSDENESSSIEYDDLHPEDDHPKIVHNQNVLDRSIVLRRGALWQSRTSLVHQLGHYLGLPHPFPDTKSCKFDADTIVDTPQQYQSSTSCDPSQPVPLCDENYKLSLEVERYPMFGFMETSTGNSTDSGTISTTIGSTDSYSDGTKISDSIKGDCRRHFSPGQVLRARAMLRMLRPELHKVAIAASESENEQLLKRLPWGSYSESNSRGIAAFQSGLPSANVVERQLALWKVSAAATAAATVSTLASNLQQQQDINMMFPDIEEAGNRLTSALDQALQAAGESVGSTSLEECTCLGPDDAGNAFWTGKLDAVYSVDAVRIVQPWESVVNTTFLATGLRSGKTSPFSSSSDDDERQVSPSLPSPEPELLPSSQSMLPLSPPPPGPKGQVLSIAVPVVEIRVGEGPNFYENRICETVELRGEKLVQDIACRGSATSSPAEGRESGEGSGSLTGQFITVRWTNAEELRPPDTSRLSGIYSTPAAETAAAAAAMPPLCLCDVAALSYSSQPIRPAIAATGKIAGAFLNTFSSSTTTSAAAAVEKGKQPRSSTLTTCSTMTFNSSSSLDAKKAYWSMPLTDTTSSTADPVLINGLRFSIPNRCSGLSLSKPKTPAAPSASASSPEGIIPLLWQPPVWNTTSLRCGDSSPSAAGGGGSGRSDNKNVTLDIYVFPAGSDIKKINDKKKGYLCAALVEVPPGQVVDIECDRTLEGHVITFFLSSMTSSSSSLVSSPLAETSERRKPPSPAAAGGSAESVQLLELCGVQPIGGITLINPDIIAAEQQTTFPESLMPSFSLAVDGDRKTCLLVDTTSLTRPTFSAGSADDSGDSSNTDKDSATSTGFTSVSPDDVSNSTSDSVSVSPSTPALWKTGLNGEYLITDVEITTKTNSNDNVAENSSGGGARGRGAGGIEDRGIQLTLFDDAGNQVAVKKLPSSLQSSGSTITSGQGDITRVISVAIIPPVYAKAVQITGFTSLCEVTFIAASRTPR